jgi:fatty-acyl-CoA synthase
MTLQALTEDDRRLYETINRENIDFLMNRYNRVNRWVVADMIRRSRYHFPDKTALIFGDISLTYTELEDQCNQVANALAGLGVKKYDRVAILARNTHHHVLTWLGCAKLGAIYLAVNYLLRDDNIAFCINHSESVVFVVEDGLYPQVKEVIAKMPGVRHFIWSNQGAGQAPPNQKFIDFNEWFTAAPKSEPDVILRIEDPVQMTYTSGTESLPKGVITSNQALISEYLSVIVDWKYEASDITINALPIFHCAQRDTFMNPLFWVGGTNILMAPDVGKILAAIEKYRVTLFFAPPTVWIAILRHPDFAQYDLSSLVKCYYGASSMPVEILRELLEKFPKAWICNGYGQTELAPFHTLLKPEDAMRKLGSAGMGALHMETRIEDLAGLEISEAGVSGEICGRGPHAMIMYFKDPDKTEAVTSGGWFHSGDLGALDDDRYVTIVDRKKDMIKTGGENVASRKVEEAIYLHPAVEEAAVVGVDHPRWVEAVVAVVKVKTGFSVSEDELLQHCRQHLAGFESPKKIVFVDELTKTPTGKILKRVMREQYRGIFQ